MMLFEKGRYEEEKIFGHIGTGIKTDVMQGLTAYDALLSIGVLG